jgi:DegV family protein with EDD domain
MKIRIVTDSTCDLPAEIAAQLGIAIVPLYINLGNKSYLDGIELSREAFYAALPDCDPLPTTAVPGSQMFLETYERLAEEGATEILSIHISAELSGIFDTARVAAREASRPVTVLDSGTLSLGIGFLAWKAAEAAADGRSMDEIVAMIEEQIQRTHVFAALDTLEFLRRSGRLNRLVATLGSWLRIKVLLKMHLGVASAERIRTVQAVTRRLITLLREQTPLEKVALVHAHAPDKARELFEQVRHLLPHKEVLSVDITPVLGAHLGPGAVGFACVRAPRVGER